ncbi:MAG: hypothetical protein KJ799_00135 [Bacteroidetes bacterium]|nr:hypothetical protein [Bacteroidota bacterium]MBU1677979.1 hypothetical protein [Bacteroidota bacterium]MBU2505131.1 hypothetical protein [Bacteroidota bacterium]
MLVPFALLFNACEEHDYYFDSTAPTAPKNITTVTGDHRVDLSWDYNRESDVAGYNVYYSYSYDGEYSLIGSTERNFYIDFDARNGVTYYYAVTAYDFNGNESELSYDVIYDTARPEGFNQTIFDYRDFPLTSGYSLSNYLVTPYDDNSTDFFFENYFGTYYLNVYKDTDIQDAGYTDNIYDIDYAPTTGWAPLLGDDNIKYEEAVVGKTYIIWTWDNHFAKIRIKQITSQRAVFDWAYQTAEGNRELKRASAKETRGQLDAVKLLSR